MSKYSVKQRIFMVLKFHELKSATEVAKEFRIEFGSHYKIDPTTIKRAYEKFTEFGTVLDNKEEMKTKSKTVRTKENIESVQNYFQENPESSQRQASRVLGIQRSSIQRIMKLDLALFPYKIQINQPISERAGVQRFEFSNKLINMKESGEIEFNKIWFSDEAHFYLHGYVNKQNWRFWGTENPHHAIIRPLHPIRLTVWCAMSSEEIIGPVFIYQNISAKTYFNMLNNEIFPYLLGSEKVEEYWFMQDGARPHRTQEIFDLLSEQFSNRIIGLDAPSKTGSGEDWPPYSPDLNPCDYFLWGYLKDKVYRTEPATLDELKIAIEQEIKKIGPDILKKTISNFETRLRHVIATEGKHFEHLLY